MSHLAFIGLGANLGQAKENILQAIQTIHSHPNINVIKSSSLYQTKPEGYLNQPDFINAVISVSTTLDPETLLDTLLALETEMGRTRPFKDAPRVIDLDLLLFDELTINTAKLCLPHPRMHSRAFVMIPLAEIAADICIPQIGHIAGLMQHLDKQGISKI